MSPGATWNFGSCKNEYTGMLVLHLLLLLSLWLIFKIWPAEVFSTGTTLKDVFQNWLKWFHFLFLEGGLFLILIDCMIFLSPFVDVTRMSMSTISFLTQVDSGILCLWNAFHWPMILEHFGLSLLRVSSKRAHSNYKTRINRHFLILCSF